MTDVNELDVQVLIRRVAKRLQRELGGDPPTVLDRTGIERLLPHREPFLLLDRVLHLDIEAGRVSAAYDLARAAPVLAGHFPGYPIWPGVLQIEAVAQAGLLIEARRHIERRQAPALTHVLGARFVRSIGAEGDVLINAEVIEGELFSTIIGQCVWRGAICSAAAVRGL